MGGNQLRRIGTAVTLAWRKIYGGPTAHNSYERLWISTVPRVKAGIYQDMT